MLPQENREQENDFSELYIRKWRGLKGMKQAELAKITGIAVSTLSNYENGKTTPSRLMTIQIAIALKINHIELFKDPAGVVSLVSKN